MVKSVGKRFLSIALVIVMVLTLLPVIQMSASATNVNTGVTGLTADSSGNATWTPSGGTLTGSVQASAPSNCTGTTYSAQNGTLTFTNSSGAVAQLTFDYSVALNGGRVEIDGAAVTAGASFSKTVGAGGTVAVKITSNESDDKATTISISNLKLTAEQDVDVTFKAPVNGAYTVKGEAITAQTVKTFKTTDSVALAATPASGYKFFGWYSSAANGFIAFSASVTTSFSEVTTVEPRFVPAAAPVFQVGSMLFTDLNEAIGYAQTSNVAQITLISSGTLPADDYTIPSGKTLLIPYDAAYTVCTTSTQVEENVYTSPSVFKKLTMASGANIVLNSGASLSVGSKISAQGQSASSHNGTPSGPHGQIDMQAGSSITAKADSGLYVYGFITGDGNVYAESNSVVYECFQIRDWRGGSASSAIASKVFPFNQYYVQNIEAPLTIYPGSTEIAFSAANMPKLSMYPSLAVEFIGSNGMFNVTSGSITKYYDKSADRLVIDVNDANATISPITLSGLPMVGSIQTENYTLPLSNKISINVNGTSTVAVNQDLSMQPGTQLKIAEGAEVVASKTIYVYDADDWNGKNFAAGGNPLVVNCYVGSTGKAGTIKAADKLDAQIEINGTLTVNDNLCTSGGGANIMSSAHGRVVLNSVTKDGTVAESASTSGEVTQVDFTAAKLKNADGTYVETNDKAPGTEIPYYNGVWGASAPTTHTVTWVNWDGSVLAAEDFEAGTEVNAAAAYTGEMPTRTADEYSYSFIGWDLESAVVNDDVTFTAKFDPIPDQYFTVKLSYRVENTDEYAITLTPILATKSARLTAENEHTVNGTTYYFSHWVFDGEEYPAHTVTIHPGQGGPESAPKVVDAYAVYTTEQKTEFPSFVKIVKNQETGTNRVVTLSYSLTDGGLVQENGVGFNVMLDGTQIGGAASQKLQNTSTGTYTVTIKNATAGMNVIGYVKYQKNGADAITLETK